MPVIPVAWDVEIGRVVIQDQFRQKLIKTLSEK
jgi:hypothetical protein